jgi:hypothetical protein
MTRLRLESEDHTPRELEFADLAQLPGQVTHRSPLFGGRELGGVRIAALVDIGGPVVVSNAAGEYVHIHAGLAREGVLVYRLGAEPLPVERGGPYRLVAIGDGEDADVKGVECLHARAAVRTLAGAPNSP